MKSPTAYGSENEEASFIRRIAAPDRAVSNRKQKNRIAVAGATIGFIAASAVVGYTALRDGGVGEVTTVPTEQLEVSAQAAPASSQFVTPLDDSFYPTFEELDINPKDGIVTRKEYLKNLEAKKFADIAEINSSSLSDDIKADLIKQVEDNYDTDGPCVVRAMKRIKANGISITAANIKLLYYTLDTFCPTKAIASPEAMADTQPFTPVAGTDAPSTQVAVSTPTGTTIVDIPIAAPGEPTTTIVVNTPTGPTTVQVPVVTDDKPSTTIVVDTPTGPTVISVPVKEGSDAGNEVTDVINQLGLYSDGSQAPATTVVLNSPSGPVAVDIPSIEEGEPTTTIVVDTPIGPKEVEIPLADKDEDSTTLVVSTPTGPAVIRVPVTEDEANGADIADIISELGGYSDDTEAPATTMVMDSPSGPVVVEIPSIEEGE
ncbi:hypothetical protein Gpo141_00012756, partial [Globisporangium polare]